MNAKKATHDDSTDKSDETQCNDKAAIAALGCYLDKKAKDVYDAAPDFPPIRSPHPRNTSHAVFGVGLKIKRTGTQQSDKLAKKDGKSYRDIQTAAMMHRQKHGNPLDMSEKVLTAFRAG
ncbi:hypothetical protein DYB37_005182 [Aphanomyces astaci]|uniref:Uncharacterized protein n=1 Tax=Aphanomyces astaci TaxID=112090 RepID=A0A3R7AZE6_APHAT|nr:hypothetical protein DYB35_007542 [Aphanomyces astaci]RHZ18936.1 hypothetical protein DYB37_005182 [Aphanomyces astaci]